MPEFEIREPGVAAHAAEMREPLKVSLKRLLWNELSHAARSALVSICLLMWQ